MGKGLSAPRDEGGRLGQAGGVRGGGGKRGSESSGGGKDGRKGWWGDIKDWEGKEGEDNSSVR